MQLANVKLNAVDPYMLTGIYLEIKQEWEFGSSFDRKTFVCQWHGRNFVKSRGVRVKKRKMTELDFTSFYCGEI